MTVDLLQTSDSLASPTILRCPEWTEQPWYPKISLQPGCFCEGWGRCQQTEEGSCVAFFAQISKLAEEPPGSAGCSSGTHARPEEHKVKGLLHRKHKAPARRWKGTLTLTPASRQSSPLSYCADRRFMSCQLFNVFRSWNRCQDSVSRHLHAHISEANCKKKSLEKKKYVTFLVLTFGDIRKAQIVEFVQESSRKIVGLCCQDLLCFLKTGPTY